MDEIENIITRRSIRSFNNKKIDETIIRKIIESGVSAPSAGNQQPWHFIVIDDKKIFKKITKFHPNASFLVNADKAILVCGDLSKEKFKGYWILDCGACTENILLAAHFLGVGSCWLGIYPREDRIKETKKLLNIPDHVIPFSLIALGYTDEKPKKIDRYQKDRIHKNKW